MERSCITCKQKINVENDDFVLKVSKKNVKLFEHKECWINRNMGFKRNPLTREKAEKEVDLLCKQSKELIKKIIIEQENKDRLYYYLLDKYNVTGFSNRFFMKLNDVYNGTYNGVSKPIPPEHLYNMWISKQDSLDRQHGKMESQGNFFKSNEQMVLYDLAVLVGRYDSYLSWLNKQQLLESEKDDNIKITSNIVVLKKVNNKPKPKKIDVVDEFLEELFGGEYDEFI